MVPKQAIVIESESILTSASPLHTLERPTYIMSCIRKQCKRCSDGTLLRADNVQGQSIIPVDFTGKEFKQSTVFYLGQNEEYQANTIKCYLDDQQYYLCVEDGRVFLSKTDDPSEKKFMFIIVPANEDTENKTIKSLETGMYLMSDKFGTASMWKIRDNYGDEPQDRRVWFKLGSAEDNMNFSIDTIGITSGDMLFAARRCEFELGKSRVHLN